MSKEKALSTAATLRCIMVHKRPRLPPPHHAVHTHTYADARKWRRNNTFALVLHSPADVWLGKAKVHTDAFRMLPQTAFAFYGNARGCGWKMVDWRCLALGLGCDFYWLLRELGKWKPGEL